MAKFWVEEVNFNRKCENGKVLDRGSKFLQKKQKWQSFEQRK